jgi:hypothetical protein
MSSTKESGRSPRPSEMVGDSVRRQPVCLIIYIKYFNVLYSSSHHQSTSKVVGRRYSAVDGSGKIVAGRNRKMSSHHPMVAGKDPYLEDLGGHKESRCGQVGGGARQSVASLGFREQQMVEPVEGQGGMVEGNGGEGLAGPSLAMEGPWWSWRWYGWLWCNSLRGGRAVTWVTFS